MTQSADSRDFATMDPREFVRGLMHGDSRELKLGYSADNATLAVCRMQAITDNNAAAELLDYADGYAAGMVDHAIPSSASATWKRGYNDGQDTDCMKVYPAFGMARP